MIVKGEVVTEPKRDYGQVAKRCAGCCVVFLICVTVVIVAIVVLRELAASGNSGVDNIKRGDARIFTTNGAKGRNGPRKLKYSGKLSGEVTLENGVQIWRVPVSGMWEIEAWGASGAQGSMQGGGAFLQGGKGAKIRGSFPLKKGELVKILVGQQGLEDYYSPVQPGGGGGGTFVVKDDKPLVVAGGGGGGGVPEPAGDSHTEGKGGRADDTALKASGQAGGGGKLYSTGNEKLFESSVGGHYVIAGAGGGFQENGVGFNKGFGGKSFFNGGKGGKPPSKSSRGISHGDRSEGGFGGGGSGALLPGAGGGFSGGGVVGCWRKAFCAKGAGGTAEGGSSINNGFSPINMAAAHKGNGKVFITLLSKEAPPSVES